jgi:CRISPR-associated protein Csh2
MSNIIQHREEFVFVYDVTDNNPNGNPMDENKPRIDEETGYNLVTDVRVKRTVRDYLFEYEGHNGENGKNIFIRPIQNDDGFVLDVKQRVQQFPNNENELVKKYLGAGKITEKEARGVAKVYEGSILKECIDTRMFGAVYSMEFPATKIDSSSKNPYKVGMTLTGPIQLRMGRSLHRTPIATAQHSFTMASGEGKQMGSLASEHFLHYSLIRIYGVVNEHAAKHTKLTEEDLELFYKALWEGTKSLHSRSKLGHSPRALVRVRYKTPNFFIGDLDKRISFKSEIADEKIRDIQDGKLDLSGLKAVFDKEKEHIASIDFKTDDRVIIQGWS